MSVKTENKIIIYILNVFFFAPRDRVFILEEPTLPICVLSADHGRIRCRFLWLFRTSDYNGLTDCKIRLTTITKDGEEGTRVFESGWGGGATCARHKRESPAPTRCTGRWQLLHAGSSAGHLCVSSVRNPQRRLGTGNNNRPKDLIVLNENPHKYTSQYKGRDEPKSGHEGWHHPPPHGIIKLSVRKSQNFD